MSVGIIELDEPITVGGQKHSQLVLREPTAMELYRAQLFVEKSSNPEAEILFDRELVSGVCGIKPAEVLDDLPVSVTDYAARQIVATFWAKMEEFSPDDATLEIELDEPVEVTDQSGRSTEYVTITLKPATTGQMRKARGYLRTSQGYASQLQYQMSLVSLCSDIPLKAIQAFPVSVVIKAAATIEVFTNPGRATGKS